MAIFGKTTSPLCSQIRHFQQTLKLPILLKMTEAELENESELYQRALRVRPKMGSYSWSGSKSLISRQGKTSACERLCLSVPPYTTQGLPASWPARLIQRLSPVK